MEIDQAMEVFVRGFAFTRSFTHAFLAQRYGEIWRLHDAPRKSGDWRVEEWIARGVPPAEVDRTARQHAQGRYAICAIHPLDQDDAPLRTIYKGLGYRLRTTEPMMIQRLEKIPRCPAPEGVTIERVLAQPLADRLAKAARARQILPEHFAADAPLRQYVARIGGEIAGWVRSIRVKLPDGKTATWCSNMYVEEAQRRRGIARAMLCRMLRDDREGGASAAVLLASHAGAKLYPVVGYDHIATLLLYGPRKK